MWHCICDIKDNYIEIILWDKQTYKWQWKGAILTYHIRATNLLIVFFNLLIVLFKLLIVFFKLLIVLLKFNLQLFQMIIYINNRFSLL